MTLKYTTQVRMMLLAREKLRLSTIFSADLTRNKWQPQVLRLYLTSWITQAHMRRPNLMFISIILMQVRVFQGLARPSTANFSSNSTEASLLLPTSLKPPRSSLDLLWLSCWTNLRGKLRAKFQKRILFLFHARIKIPLDCAAKVKSGTEFPLAK